jgi:hypothetical protein
VKWSSEGGTEFEQAPTGAQVARCIKLIDIGTQTGEWQGKPTHKRQVIITWELPKCLMSEGEYAGQPFTISKFYTASLSDRANLRHDLVAWRGREFSPEELAGFDAKNILGKTCMLNIIRNDKGKSRVDGVMQVPQGFEVPPQVNPSFYFSLDEFDSKAFEQLSKGIRGMVEASPEYRAIANPEPSTGHGFDDVKDDIPWEYGDDRSSIPF